MQSRETYHHGALRAALLSEGHALLAETGAEAFSINALARRVGVSAAAPYRHFVDRTALLDAIADQGYGIFGTALKRAVDGAASSGEAIRRIGLAYLSFAATESTYFSIMFRDRGDRPNDAGLPTFETFAAAVAAAQRDGALDPGSEAAALARGMWAGLHGAAMLEAAGAFAKVGIAASRTRLVDDVLGPYLRW